LKKPKSTVSEILEATAMCGSASTKTALTRRLWQGDGRLHRLRRRSTGKAHIAGSTSVLQKILPLPLSVGLMATDCLLKKRLDQPVLSLTTLRTISRREFRATARMLSVLITPGRNQSATSSGRAKT